MDPRPLRFVLPPTYSEQDTKLLAERLIDETCYNVAVNGNEWTITPKPARPAFRPIPLIRDDVPPDRQKVNICTPALRGIRYWPLGPCPDANARHEAAQNLIDTTHTWTVEEFFRIRESFAGLVHHPSPESFEESLPSLVRALKTALPNATVDVLRIDPQQFAASSVVRLLALIPDIGPAELKAITEAEPRGRGGPYYTFDPKPYFELLSNINYPRTAGFGIWLGLESYVIVDYGIQVTLPPIDSSERRARDIGARVLLAPRSDTIETKAFPRFSHADRHFLRAWLAQRLNYLYAQLTSLHLASQDEGGSLVTTDLWKDLLTVEDIVGLTQLVATTSDPAVLRLVFFDLIDRYGQLGGSPWRKVDAILSDGFIQSLADSLANDLLDIREPLKEWLLDSWKRVSDEAWEGVLSAETRAARRFTTSLPGEPPTTLEGGQFVSKWLRAMRNTTHGYHLSYKMFERYLAHHEGVLPGAVRELAIALWLCFMSSPQLFWPRPERFGTLRRIEPPPSARRSI